jgi:hypothetical protein
MGLTRGLSLSTWALEHTIGSAGPRVSRRGGVRLGRPIRKPFGTEILGRRGGDFWNYLVPKDIG